MKVFLFLDKACRLAGEIVLKNLLKDLALIG